MIELGGDYMIPVGRDEILSRSRDSAEISAVLLTLHKSYPAITCEKFHPSKVGSRFCTVGISLCRNEIFPCNHFSPLKQDEKIN